MYVYSDWCSTSSTFTYLRVMPVEKTELTATNVRLGAFSLSRGKFAVCLVCSTISFIPDCAWVQGFANHQGVFLPILQTQLWRLTTGSDWYWTPGLPMGGSKCTITWFTMATHTFLRWVCGVCVSERLKIWACIRSKPSKKCSSHWS